MPQREKRQGGRASSRTSGPRVQPIKIFLSHSHFDKKLAERVKVLLSVASQGIIEPWLSSSLDGLRPGDALWDEVHAHLETADKIVTILTENSYNRPWLLYESGYVAGRMRGAKVVPLLFGIEKGRLPSPLSGYSLYAGDNPEDLCRLLLQVLAEMFPEPDELQVKSRVDEFLRDLPNLIVKEPPLDHDDSERHTAALGLRFINKVEASEILMKRLADRDVSEVIFVTYTNEVEGKLLTHYRVVGRKKITILKRSLFADLADQQSWNLIRLAAGSTVKPWDKREISFDASHDVDEQFTGNPEVELCQFLYDGPPAHRAYIFDRREAIISSYERTENPILEGGSLYKGMTDRSRLLVSNQSPLGSYLLEDLLEHVHTLQSSSHTWEEEKKAWLEGSAWAPLVRMPCLHPAVAMLDMDGVLYDSMAQYVRAWQEAFREIGLDLPAVEVFRQEGRPGRQTIEAVLAKLGGRKLSERQIEQILARKSEVLLSLGAPAVQTGAKQLISVIAGSGLKLWIVTGSTRPGIAEQIARDFAPHLRAEQVVTGNDYRTGKPQPEPYLLAATRAGVRPEQAIAIENSPLGIQSADAAGTFCIAVNTGELTDLELKRAGARAVFRSCDHLAQSWDRVLAVLRA